jgi:murein DD-endopeptidase MepM/ murein hydrolase activator NlpD
MKRNKLLNNEQHAHLFSSQKPKRRKSRHIISISILAAAGIFVSNMLMATSERAAPIAQTQSIALPGQQGVSLTAANDNIESAKLKLNKPALNAVNTSIESEQLVEPSPHLSDKLIGESTEIEALYLEQQDSVEAPKSDINSPTLIEETPLSWNDITVKSGDNLSIIFPKVGLSAKDVYQVMQSGDASKPLLNLKPGQQLRFGLQELDDTQPKLSKLELIYSPIETLQLAWDGEQYSANMLTRDLDTHEQILSGEISSSLFEAGLSAGMSDKLIMQLAYVFGWDIDFALDLRKGDHFKVIYEEAYLDGNKYSDGDILAAEFTNQGKTFRAIRYTDKEGQSNFFTPDGDSMRKAFLRTPVDFTRISSKFNPNRKHPIFNTSRPHRGVDYAAPTGTPIKSSGDGKIIFAGTKGGYGKTVIVQHGQQYTTLYAHMSRIKPGMRNGLRVSQGQVIGYVGSTCYATGPHLHYEFRVNGVHKNPLTVSLPHAEPLKAAYLADFKQKASPLLAQLDGVTIPTLAANQTLQ